MIKNKFIIEHLILFGLFSSFTLPGVNLYGFNLYLITYISFPLFFVLLFCMVNGCFKINKITCYMVFLSCIVLLTAIISWTKGLVPWTMGDVNESFKFLQFIPYCYLVSLLEPQSFLLKFKKYMFFSMWFVIAIGVIQYSQIPVISSLLINLYLPADSVHLLSALSGYRITITGSDPNIGGAILALFVFYSFTQFLIEREKKYIMALVLCIILLFSTQSRTSIIAVIMSMLLFVMFYSNFKLFNKLIIIAVLSCVFIFVFLFLDIDYIIQGIYLTLSGENVSLNLRLDYILQAYHRFMLSPLFGWGPSKGLYTAIIDSEYALIIQRYGLLGVSVFLLFIFYIYKLAVNNKVIGSKILLMYLFFSLFFMFTNNMFSGYQTMAILVVLIFNNMCLQHIKHINNNSKVRG